MVPSITFTHSGKRKCCSLREGWKTINYYYSHSCPLLIFKMWENSRCAPDGWSRSPIVSELGLYCYRCHTDKLVSKVRIYLAGLYFKRLPRHILKSFFPTCSWGPDLGSLFFPHVTAYRNKIRVHPSVSHGFPTLVCGRSKEETDVVIVKMAVETGVCTEFPALIDLHGPAGCSWIDFGLSHSWSSPCGADASGEKPGHSCSPLGTWPCFVCSRQRLRHASRPPLVP